MIFGWVHVVLIFCSSSASSQTDNNEEVEIVCVPENATVVVPCPARLTKDYVYSLWRGSVVLLHRLNATEKGERGLQEVHFNQQNYSFVLVAQQQRVGQYNCVAEKIFPPPYHKSSSRPVLVLLRGQQCSSSCSGSASGQSGDETTFNVRPWAVGLGVTSTLGLVSTIVAVVSLFRLKRAESCHTDYINTKPKAGGPHGRGRGVQHPAPKRF